MLQNFCFTRSRLLGKSSLCGTKQLKTNTTDGRGGDEPEHENEAAAMELSVCPPPPFLGDLAAIITTGQVQVGNAIEVLELAGTDDVC